MSHNYRDDQHYDHRKHKRGRDRDERRSHENDDDERKRASAGKQRRSVERSRSRSPTAAAAAAAAAAVSKKHNVEHDRQARMAQLRMENEKEETKLAALEDKQQSSSARPRINGAEAIVQVDAAELEGLDEDAQMEMLLGFSGGFGTTKGEKVASNQSTAAVGVAAKHKARKYRQYMNRKNGFNRPLDKMD